MGSYRKVQQATTGRMKLAIVFLLSGLLAYASAASTHRREPMESPKDHLHDVGAPAMVRDDHRRVHMESAADHAHDVGAPAKDRNDHRAEAMETAEDHIHDVSG